MSLKSRLGIRSLLVLLTIIFLTFQNCSPQFKVAGDTELASIIQSTPDPVAEQAPQHSVNNVNTKQGDELVFTISIPTAQAQNLNLSYETLNDTAIVGSDFFASAGTISIPAGQTTATLRVKTRLQKPTSATLQLKLRVFTSSNGQIIRQAEGVGLISPSVSPLKLKQITAGDSHYCGITPSNTAVCWGSNINGELGTNLLISKSHLPQQVNGLSNVTQIAAGANHTCALSNGSIYCWGINVSGQLGNGTLTDSRTPVLVNANMGTIVQILASSSSTYAINSVGQIYEWGGNPSAYQAPRVINMIPSLTTPNSLVAFNSTVCYISNQNSVLCLGNNLSGQLGRAPQLISFEPLFTAVPNVTNALELSAGYKHICARRTNDVMCWGGLADPSDSQSIVLSPGATTGSFQPVSLALAGVQKIKASRYHTCSINADSTVFCWGRNIEGQIGNGSPSTQNFNQPTLVVGLTGAQEIASSNYSNCVRNISDDIFCWGANYYGETGSNFNYSPPLASDVTGVNSVLKIGRSLGSIKCIISGIDPASAQVLCRDYFNYSYSVVPGTQGAIDVVTSGGAACAIIGPNRNIKCWGDNTQGQLGNGTTTSSLTPVDVIGLSGVKSITSGHFHFCVISSTDTVKCWGYNLFRQLGVATIPQTATPVDVPNLVGVKAIAAGGNTTCIINNQNNVSCWGAYPGFLQLQLPNETLRNLDGMTGAIKISVSPSSPLDNHVCAVLLDGSVRCWGMNNKGQLGNGTIVNSSVGVNVLNITTAKDISISYESSCALLVDDTLRCWGNNYFGHFGIVSNSESITSPVIAFGGQKVTGFDLSAGEAQFITSEGTLRSSGQRGSRMSSPQQLVVVPQ